MEINLVELNLATLQQLQNGDVFRQAQKLIQQAVADCESRLAEKRPRKVVIQLEIEPVTSLIEVDDEHTKRVLDGVKLRLQMDIKCPTRKTMEFDCGVGDGHALLFNPDNPHNHRQAALPLTFEGEVATVPMAAQA